MVVVDRPDVKVSRAYATASAWTFKIQPIKQLLIEWVGDGHGWVDPFAGRNSLAEWTNDIDPEAKAGFHLDAKDFAELMEKAAADKGYRYEGVLFDPPYSYRQISEHYKAAGRKATQLDTSYNFYARVMDPLARALKVGGHAISFGWNSNGFGIKRGFEKRQILLVAHGLHHNDTIVTVEEKVADARV